MNLPVVNAHREGVDLHRSLPVDEHLAKIVFDSQDAEYASEEMLCIVDCMESNQVSSKNAFQYGSPPFRRERSEYVVRWEGGVEEESDGKIRHLLSQELREKHEMVVVDPDSVVWLDHFQ